MTFLKFDGRDNYIFRKNYYKHRYCKCNYKEKIEPDPLRKTRTIAKDLRQNILQGFFF